MQKEYYEAKALHQYLEARRIPHTHIANEHGGHVARASMAKAIGVSAGFPDFLIFLPNGINVALELKAVDGGKESKLQRQWLDLLETRGFVVGVCKGFYKAKDFIDEQLKNPADQAG